MSVQLQPRLLGICGCIKVAPLHVAGVPSELWVGVMEQEPLKNPQLLFAASQPARKADLGTGQENSAATTGSGVSGRDKPRGRCGLETEISCACENRAQLWEKQQGEGKKPVIGIFYLRLLLLSPFSSAALMLCHCHLGSAAVLIYG